MTGTLNIRSDELRPGDLLAYGGTWRRITDVVRRAGGSWPIAVDGTGWGIALGDRPVSVLRA